MGQQPMNPPVKVIESNGLPQVIYADRIINAGFGAAVSRLTLAMETGPNTFTSTATLVVPTPALLETMTGVLNAIQGNPEIEEGILKALEALKAQISAIKSA